MTPLITKSDLDQYKYIADSVKNTTTWPQFVSEAQMLDIKPWLGDALLMEIIGQKETSPESISVDNQTLLDGGIYTYQSVTYHFQGLKAAIIYYAFSRFTSKQPYNYTAAGIVIKDSDLSTPAPDKAVQRLSTEALLTASAIRDEILLYLRRVSTSTKYPLFNTCSKHIRPRTFIAIGD